MTWKDTCPMNEKVKFISAYLSNDFSFSKLCERFGISRKTGYKWVERYNAEGVEGLKDRSRANHEPHNATSNDIVEQLLEVKHHHPYWGPKKVSIYLENKKPNIIWPAISTIGDIFNKHGLTQSRKYRRKVPPHAKPFSDCDESNRVWSADFKGQFKLGQNGYCYPLTITDNYSRYLLACKGLSEPNTFNVKKWFERVFIEFGLPEAIRTDNGPPFSSVCVGGLSRLAIWWIKLGITPERIEPGNPQQNGRHERMHRTLKQATANPPKNSFSAQQRLFNEFMDEYNNERPHEALDGLSPSDIYKPSEKDYPSIIQEYEYPDNFYIRRVKLSGEFKFAGGIFNLGKPLAGEIIGLEPIENELYQIYFNSLKLAVFDERLRKVVRINT